MVRVIGARFWDPRIGVDRELSITELTPVLGVDGTYFLVGDGPPELPGSQGWGLWIEVSPDALRDLVARTLHEMSPARFSGSAPGVLPPRGGG